MIQDYIKTGMVVYDTADKQHFRNECCKETFYHYIDADHFPSFQFFTEMPISLEGFEIQLYDLNDNLIGTFDNADFNAVNTVYHGVNGYQYVHNVVDIISYPAGYDNETGYYIKICASTPEQFIHLTETNGSATALISGTTNSPVIYYYNNKSYQAWKQREAVGYDSRGMIWAYDHIANTESANYDLRSVSEVAGNMDYHSLPVVIVADDGHIVVAQEFQRIGAGNHNDAITIKRSDNPEDETSWVNAKAENAGYWTFIGTWQPDNSERLAYPNISKDHAGNLYVICRRYVTGGNWLRIYKSTDHGVSWDGGHDITYSGAVALWHYPVPIKTPTSDVLRIAIRYLDTALSGAGAQKNYYMESSDGGVTWGDISGSHSQDTTISPILQATLDNAAYDYLVADCGDFGHDLMWVESGTVDYGNGDVSPYLQTIEYDDPAVDYGFRMFWWNGANWINSLIVDNSDVLGRVTLIHRENNEFVCTIPYLDGADNQLALYQTSNLTDWAKEKDIKLTTGLTAQTFITTHFTFNYHTAEYLMGAAPWGTNVNYGDIFIQVWHTQDCWYSEAFRVCDCEVEGVGDGLNLVEGGWFEDWSGAADPNNVPVGWTVIGNNATNYVHDAGGECQMISDVTNVVRIEQTILEIGKWYVWNINVTAVPDPFIHLYNGVTILLAINTLGNHSVVFQATSTIIRIYPFGVTNVTFTDVRIEEFIGFEFCDMLTLNWWSDCDWDSIIYQYGYRNSLVLDSDLQTPTEDIVINPDERQGEMFVHDVIIKKRYKFNIRIPEYLWNALIRLPAYGSEMPNFHCWITLPDGSACPMSEVAILGEWDVGNCMNTFTVEFVDNDEYPVVATNCCDNEDVSEI